MKVAILCLLGHTLAWIQQESESWILFESLDESLKSREFDAAGSILGRLGRKPEVVDAVSSIVSRHFGSGDDQDFVDFLKNTGLSPLDFFVRNRIYSVIDSHTELLPKHIHIILGGISGSEETVRELGTYLPRWLDRIKSKVYMSLSQLQSLPLELLLLVLNHPRVEYSEGYLLRLAPRIGLGTICRIAHKRRVSDDLKHQIADLVLIKFQGPKLIRLLSTLYAPPPSFTVFIQSIVARAKAHFDASIVKTDPTLFENLALKVALYRTKTSSSDVFVERLLKCVDEKDQYKPFQFSMKHGLFEAFKSLTLLCKFDSVDAFRQALLLRDTRFLLFLWDSRFLDIGMILTLCGDQLNAGQLIKFFDTVKNQSAGAGRLLDDMKSLSRLLSGEQQASQSDESVPGPRKSHLAHLCGNPANSGIVIDALKRQSDALRPQILDECLDAACQAQNKALVKELVSLFSQNPTKHLLEFNRFYPHANYNLFKLILPYLRVEGSQRRLVREYLFGRLLDLTIAMERTDHALEDRHTVLKTEADGWSLDASEYHEFLQDCLDHAADLGKPLGPLERSYIWLFFDGHHRLLGRILQGKGTLSEQNYTCNLFLDNFDAWAASEIDDDDDGRIAEARRAIYGIRTGRTVGLQVLMEAEETVYFPLGSTSHEFAGSFKRTDDHGIGIYTVFNTGEGSRRHPAHPARFPLAEQMSIRADQLVDAVLSRPTPTSTLYSHFHPVPSSVSEESVAGQRGGSCALKKYWLALRYILGPGKYMRFKLFMKVRELRGVYGQILAGERVRLGRIREESRLFPLWKYAMQSRILEADLIKQSQRIKHTHPTDYAWCINHLINALA